MNEQELARKIAKHLDHGVDGIQSATRYRLQAGRLVALARCRQPKLAFGMAWAGDIGSFFGRGRITISHYLAAAALLIVSAVGITYWQMTSDDDTDIELSLLTDELPINAYLDNEFQTWLKRSSE
jgi:hypothetical protein